MTCINRSIFCVDFQELSDAWEHTISRLQEFQYGFLSILEVKNHQSSSFTCLQFLLGYILVHLLYNCFVQVAVHSHL